MIFKFFAVQRRKSGCRPVIVGQPNDHIMDWSGCNFHYLPFPGMQRKFMSLAVAKALMKAADAKQDLTALRRYCRPLKGKFGPRDEEIVG